MIYFDYNSTTQPAPEVSEAMKIFLDISSLSEKELTAIVEKSRSQVASLIGANDPTEIVFTAGETENNNLTIFSLLKANSHKKHIVTTTFENEFNKQFYEKLETEGYKISWLEVDENGFINLNELKNSLKHETAFVSITMANNETGVLLPIEEIAEIIKTNSEAIFHVDGTNAVGKIPLDLKKTKIDLFTFDGHKIHAPKEIGALYIRDRLKIKNDEKVSIDKIVRIGTAADLVKLIEPKVSYLRDKLEDSILERIPIAKLNGIADRNHRLPNTSSITFPNLNGEVILAKLNEVGIIASTASICNTENRHSASILQAMNIPFTEIMGTIRFSLGRYNTEEEVGFCVKHLVRIIKELDAIRY